MDALPYLKQSLRLLYGYNTMVKRDPQYKLDKPYSPKTDIDAFIESHPEINELVKQMIKDGDIIRKSNLTDFGDYDKKEYLIGLLNGEVVNCWPNAGYMTAMDGSGRDFEPSDVWSFRLNPNSEA